MIHSYSMRLKGIDTVCELSVSGSKEKLYQIGDRVWVKPQGYRCHTQFDTGVVTNVISDQAVEVDGMPRHLRDGRPRTDEEGEEEEDSREGSPSAEHESDSESWTPPNIFLWR